MKLWMIPSLLFFCTACATNFKHQEARLPSASSLGQGLEGKYKGATKEGKDCVIGVRTSTIVFASGSMVFSFLAGPEEMVHAVAEGNHLLVVEGHDGITAHLEMTLDSTGLPVSAVYKEKNLLSRVKVECLDLKRLADGA